MSKMAEERIKNRFNLTQIFYKEVYTSVLLSQIVHVCLFVLDNVTSTQSLQEPPWRNRLARSAVNRKVGGSSPPGGVYLLASLGKFYAICNGSGPTLDNRARWSRGMILA